MHTNRLSKNYLLNATCNGESSKEVFRVVFRLAKEGKRVLYIAAKSPESLPIEDEYDDTLYREIMKNVVFCYWSTVEDIIKYFTGMKRLQPKPAVVVVDFLHTFYDSLSSLDVNLQQQLYFMETHMLATAALHNVIDMLTDESKERFISILCIDTEHHYIYKRFMQTYIDSYYYKVDCILSLSDLPTFFT